MIARTKFFTFTLTFLIIYTFLASIFGENGLKATKDAKVYSKALEEEISKKEAEIRMLRSEFGKNDVFNPSMFSESVILLKGENVEIKDETSKDDSDSIKETFKPLSYPKLAFFSLIPSLLFTFTLERILRRRYEKHSHREKRREY